MSSISNPRDFNILGMNLGANQADYTLLHGKIKIAPEDTIEKLFNELSDSSKVKQKGEIEEKLFFLLQTSSEKLPSSSNFAQLIFNKGLDILESRMDEDKILEFVKTYPDELAKSLEEKITDKSGAHKFKELYPKLHSYLVDHYNQRLPKYLKKSGFKQFVKSAKAFFASPDLKKTKSFTAHPQEKHLQQLKDRLAVSFFERVLASAEKPAVITLQEVQRSNSAVLETLKKGGYQIIHPKGTSDTAIAIDTNRFQLQNTYETLPDEITAISAIDKEILEEFIFVTVHTPGYKLEFPSDPALMENHLKNVEGSLESGAFRAIEVLKKSVELLQKQNPTAKVIVQGDFNSYPEYFTHDKIPTDSKIKEMNIFSALEGQPGSTNEADLALFRTNQPTELNRHADDLQARELDYVFVSKSLTGRIHPLQSDDQELTLANVSGSNVHFDPQLLFSDHRPMWMKISGEKPDVFPPQEEVETSSQTESQASEEEAPPPQLATTESTTQPSVEIVQEPVSEEPVPQEGIPAQQAKVADTPQIVESPAETLKPLRRVTTKPLSRQEIATKVIDEAFVSKTEDIASRLNTMLFEAVTGQYEEAGRDLKEDLKKVAREIHEINKLIQTAGGYEQVCMVTQFMRVKTKGVRTPSPLAPGNYKAFIGAIHQVSDARRKKGVLTWEQNYQTLRADYKELLKHLKEMESH